MQVNAVNYKTKSFISEKKLPKVLGNNQHRSRSIAGLDIGWSGTKVIGGNVVACVPSIIKPTKDVQIVSELKDTDIILEDHTTGQKYYVGEFAYNQMNSTDIRKMNDELLYDRYWYHSEIFRIMAAAGTALALPDNYAKTDIYIQTGLPCEYIADKDEVKDELLHPYDFSMQVGNHEPKRYTFTPKGVDVMEQPQGALYAVMYNEKGDPIPSRSGLLMSNTKVWDNGFNTEDIYALKARTLDFHKTNTDVSQRAVFEAVLDEINGNLSRPMQVFELQKYLETGIVRYYDRKSNTQKEIDILELLNKNTEKLTQISINRLMKLSDDFSDTDALILTGGTNALREEMIRERIGGLVTVISGNENDPSIPLTHCNALGYYYRMYNKLKREMQ